MIGEHTDYNGGYVLPTVIPQRTTAALAIADGATARVMSAALHDMHTYQLGAEARTGGWIDYVQGVTWALRMRGARLSGFDLQITSDVPLGSGLSSSAALEVSVLRALRAAFGLSVDDVEIAMLGHRAEVEHVGAPVGIMDQLAASLGRNGSALFLDTRTLVTEEIPLPQGAELLVINSGVRHAHATGAYRTRRRECTRAARLLGIPALRDADAAVLAAAALPAPLDGRARHVVTENGRVLDMVSALRHEDLCAAGALMNASHVSMQYAFEVSTTDIDVLVRLAQAEPGVYGARLTGGGFGGAIVALTERGRAQAAGQRIANVYRTQTGQTPAILVPLNTSK